MLQLAPAFDPTTFSKNRQRLLEAEVFEEFFSEVVEQARKKFLLSDEHFTVDGTLIEAFSLAGFVERNAAVVVTEAGSGRVTVRRTR